MAGHSHWANIAIKKARVDKKRGKLFTKLSRAIIVAAQHGGPDPDSNLALRYAIEKARKASMPNDNIDRAIRRGCGDVGGDKYEELLYEGYGPAGVAVLCEILTENRNRTAGEIRRIFEVNGGNLGATGCVAWMFDRRAQFVIDESVVSEEAVFELALEAGADDVSRSGNHFVVLGSVDTFQAIASTLEAAGIPTVSSEIARIPQNQVELDGESASGVLKLIDALEDNDDIQNVTANFSLPEDVMQAALAGG
ncbi:MAG: YebC/PmpR family DNA-binding transcriptional regulator [Planctomycetaceae bacterium]|nr:YebC/PmpR family DNA-binding transcriptional regulator [Planctomycetaceae bacterium]